MRNYIGLLWLLLLLLTLTTNQVHSTRYEANWTSLDTRPIPEWYDKAKIGIFMHWGVFSVPSFGSEWFWAYWKGGNPSIVEFMKKNYRPGFTYQDFAPQFTAEFYDPEEWANIFKAAGDLATAIRNVTPDIHFGVYHSLYEWYNPLYQMDKKNNFTTNKFSMGKTMPELYELVNNYHPEVIWSDGDWEIEDWYWNSTVFLAWLFNDSPVKDTVLVNDRWGKGIPCHHGSFYNCKDRYNPGVLQTHKWENAMTLDKKSWGYRRTAAATDYLTIQEVLKTVAMTISCGGNILINIGPTKDGRIPAIMEERLRQMGTWLNINGDAIYESQPWTHQNDSVTEDVWYTQKGSSVYAIVLNWPDRDVLTLGSVVGTASTKISMLGFNQDSSPLQYKMMRKGLQVVFPPMSQVSSQWAWVLIMQDIMPAKRASRKLQKFVPGTPSPNHIWNYNP